VAEARIPEIEIEIKRTTRADVTRRRREPLIDFDARAAVLCAGDDLREPAARRDAPDARNDIF